MGVVSRAQVLKGVGGGFAQVCHGKRAPLARMNAGDWLLYYSPSTAMEGGAPLKAFTAIGRIVDKRTYLFDMGGGFVPWRRDVEYLPTRHDAALELLRPVLSFTRGGANWGPLARRGHFEVELTDVAAVAKAMGAVTRPERLVAPSTPRLDLSEP